MNETNDAVALPSSSGRLVQPGIWALANGDEVALGGRVGRLLARWLDLCSVYGAFILLTVALSTQSMLLSIVVGLLTGMLALGQVFGVALWGRTLGKLVFGLKIIHRSGRPIGALRGLMLREGVRVLAEFTGILVLIDLALIFRVDRRTLHDLLSGSVVVHQPVDWARVLSARARAHGRET